MVAAKKSEQLTKCFGKETGNEKKERLSFFFFSIFASSPVCRLLRITGNESTASAAGAVVNTGRGSVFETGSRHVNVHTYIQPEVPRNCLVWPTGAFSENRPADQKRRQPEEDEEDDE